MAREKQVDIALVGFNDRERLLMNSFFKVSGTYREWQEDLTPQPDCVLMDIDEETVRACGDMELEHPSGSPIVAIGAEITGKSVAAYIPRPFRWADLLEALATATKKDRRCVEGDFHTVFPEAESLAKRPRYIGVSDSLAVPRDGLSDDAAKISIADVPAKATTKAPTVLSARVSAKATPARKRVYKTVGAVLVVNPNPTGWRHISAEVANLGYRVDHVSSAEAAALLLANFRYNCVIVETQLADQEGFELCKMLKKRQGRRRTATIVLTTSRNPLDAIRSKYVGCDAFLSKPIDKEELARTLKKFLPEYVLEKTLKDPAVA